jgi:hypothetical protein
MKGADFGRSPTKQQAALDTEGMSYAQLSANEAGEYIKLALDCYSQLINNDANTDHQT